MLTVMLGWETFQFFQMRSTAHTVDQLQQVLDHNLLTQKNLDNAVETSISNIEIFIDKSVTQINRLSEYFCEDEAVLKTIEFEEFVFRLFQSYLEAINRIAINRITIGITARLQGNRGEIVARDLCIACNKNTEGLTKTEIKQFCRNYFTAGDAEYRYGLNSIDLLHTTADSKETLQ